MFLKLWSFQGRPLLFLKYRRDDLTLGRKRERGGGNADVFFFTFFQED